MAGRTRTVSRTPRRGGHFSMISISTRVARLSSAVSMASARDRCSTGGASCGRRSLSRSRRRTWRRVGMSSLSSGTAWCCGFGGQCTEPIHLAGRCSTTDHYPSPRCVTHLTPRLWKQHFAAILLASDIGKGILEPMLKSSP